MNTADARNDCDLHLGRARAHINDLAQQLSVALDLAIDNARGVTWANDARLRLARDLERVLDVASRLASVPRRDLTRQLDVVRALGSDLIRIHLDANDVDFAHHIYDRTLVRARVAASDLTDDIERALSSDHAFLRGRADGIANDNAADTARGQPGAGRRVAPLARRLLAAATRILPADHRARYAEEFRSELAEIALGGARRHTQLAYAARQVMSSGRLRLEVRAPQQRGAAP